MKKKIDTEYQALNSIAEMVIKFGQLYVLNISQEDWKKVQTARDSLEMIIHRNGYRMNYDKNLKNNIIKL